jgi:hypothetical protein
MNSTLQTLPKTGSGLWPTRVFSSLHGDPSLLAGRRFLLRKNDLYRHSIFATIPK